MIERIQAAIVAATWLGLAAMFSLGVAGVVAGFDHPAGDARPELTWAGDEAIRPTLDSAASGLAELADDVDRLGSLGRLALSALVDRNEERLAEATAEGANLVESIGARAGALRRELNAAPGIGRGAELRIGVDELARHALLVDALDGISSLDDAWSVLTSAGLTATRMTALLEGHDDAAFAATTAGRAGDWDAALERLDEAEAALADAAQLRDRLENSIDVGTLTEWLRRNGDYDATLRALYSAFRDSKGRVTPAVREALEAEAAARARLPTDPRGIVIVLAEIARGGANQAVIAIEEVRGGLGAALEELEARG